MSNIVKIEFRFHKATQTGYKQFSIPLEPTKIWPESKQKVAENAFLRSQHSDLYKDIYYDDGTVESELADIAWSLESGRTIIYE